MSKVYISGAISGTNDFLERFARAEAHLARQGYSVVNPAKVNNVMPEDTSYEEYMAMSMTMLGLCDEIYMLSGWEKSLGANREYGYALGAGKKITFEGGR